ncbi:MAG: hypothetical protein Q4E35_04760 [Eubacteriales bacterium]|nr:hypothetical protein [Eubacteriales bacterium]
MELLKKLAGVLEKYKVPVLVFSLGLLLLLLPGSGMSSTPKDSETKLQEVLCRTQGVGRSLVIISENGVVVVCSGADKASVRMDVLRSVRSYTGFSSDKVTILKMND